MKRFDWVIDLKNYIPEITLRNNGWPCEMDMFVEVDERKFKDPETMLNRIMPLITESIGKHGYEQIEQGIPFEGFRAAAHKMISRYINNMKYYDMEFSE